MNFKGAGGRTITSATPAVRKTSLAVVGWEKRRIKTTVGGKGKARRLPGGFFLGGQREKKSVDEKTEKSEKRLLCQSAPSSHFSNFCCNKEHRPAAGEPGPPRRAYLSVCERVSVCVCVSWRAARRKIESRFIRFCELSCGWFK